MVRSVVAVARADVYAATVFSAVIPAGVLFRYDSTITSLVMPG